MSTLMNMRRGYRMEARAESTRKTRQRILDAAVALLRERLRSDIRLEAIAERAGVGVQTILRHFGSRAGLLDQAIAGVRSLHAAARPAMPGDVAHAVTLLFDQYEELGDLLIRNLAQEDFDPALKKMLDVGRAFHRDWVLAQFLPQAPARSLRRRQQETVDALVVACDVYCWKLLRRDMGVERGRAERTMRRLVEGVLTTAKSEAED